ncbi:reverse transcriptase family protein [Vibrio vulnificus]|nr:reverse transcriptase family protein [Vibrio vulnificus]
MNNIWRPQLYRSQARSQGIPTDIVNHAVAIGDRITSKGLNIPIIFNLEHLAKLSGVDYDQVYKLTKRAGENSSGKDYYRIFAIRKKDTKSKRYICVPSKNLLRVQKYINQFILHNLKSHPSSMAYNKGCKIVDVANVHRQAKWLLKIDIEDFFENISEVDIYKIFVSSGYSKLLSFQLARLCTRIVPYQKEHAEKYSHSRWRAHKKYNNKNYNFHVIGSLPQGAPTSPLLANLVLRELDEKITKIALSYGVSYTRYSDDLTFSSCDTKFGRKNCYRLIREIYDSLYSNGFSPKKSKTKIISPGSRKIVLGLLVDGNKPKLTKEFKANILRHLHFCNLESVGPVQHAKHQKFDSVIGFKNHLKGLVSYSLSVDPKFGSKVKSLYESIDWPSLPFN